MSRDAATGRTVIVVLFDAVQSLDVVGPVEVFSSANRWLQAAGRPAEYDIGLAATTARSVATQSPIRLTPTHRLADLGPCEGCDTLLVPGGSGVYAARDDRDLVRWIQLAAARSRRVASVCSGAFLLAEAGVLGAAPVTTHWSAAGRLATDYPNLVVDPDPIYTRNGKVWTSAGVTAGIDLALAMVEEDLGADAAQAIARYLVMFTRRPGGQSQFAATVWADPAEHEPIRAVQHQVLADPGADLSVPALAGRAGMSERNFARVFSREVGETPGRFVERVRVDAARRELERTGLGVEAIADRCGFGTAETMRRAFLRHVGVAPSDYRRRFALT